MKNDNNRGSVTVYLILVFVVLVMLITGVISSLRYEAERVNSETTLHLSQEAAFSKYFRPLLEEYGLYYYISEDEDGLEADIMGYFIKNQEHISKLLSVRPVNLEIIDKEYALDKDAKNVKEQMDAVVKDTIPAKAIDNFKKQIGLFEEDGLDNSGELERISDDIKEAENDAEKEKDMLLLLKLVEGITVVGEKIKCDDDYVKKAIPGNVSARNAGVDSPKVWEAVKNKKWNYLTLLEKVKKNALLGAEGRNAVFPVADIAEWCDKLERILKVTREAEQTAKRVVGIKGGICNPENFVEKLDENIRILNRLIGLSKITQPKSRKDWEKIYVEIDTCIELAKTYHVKDLRFDYSSLKTSDVENPLDNADGKLCGLFDLLVQDTSDISFAAVMEAGIYEKLAKSSPETFSKESAIDFEDLDSVTDTLDECKNDGIFAGMGDELMKYMYIDEYFFDYETGRKTDAGKLTDTDKSTYADSKTEPDRITEHALKYETEYLLCANKSDRENLESTVRKILLLRMGMSIVYLVSDQKSKELAYGTAACLVGFAGLDALVRCVQYSILAVWAYEDACVDTAILLSGKKIPTVKTKDTLRIEFGEMLLFNKELIASKVNSYQESEKGVTYGDYVKLLLMGVEDNKLIYRCMDIIQFNMKKNYDSRFSLQQAVYGARVRLVCDKPYYYVANSSFSYE